MKLESKKQKLINWVNLKIQIAKVSGEEFFFDVPDSWYEPIRFGCENGHVSKMYLKSESLGLNLCLECHKPISMIPPGTTEKFLTELLGE